MRPGQGNRKRAGPDQTMHPESGNRRPGSHWSLPWLLLIGCVLLLPSGIQAHEARPVFVQLTEIQPNRFTAHWKVPFTIPEYALPELALPEICTSIGERIRVTYPDAWILNRDFACSEPLSGREIRLVYPLVNPSVSSIFRIRLYNGEVHSGVAEPGRDRWRLPMAESLSGVAGQYLNLGVRHIFAGVDHLLFIACLMIIAGTGRRILITITGFTIAHSLTLALSTLGLMRLPVPPTEAAIALSIVYLAHEIARGDRVSWTWRYPFWISGAFGLLHGFGFAAVLQSIGLPQTELPAALLFFNLGVELGQILFLLPMALLFIALRRCARMLPSSLFTGIPSPAIVSAYLIGPVAAFWLMERIAGFFTV